MIAWTIPRKVIEICSDKILCLFVFPQQKIWSHNSRINFAQRGGASAKVLHIHLQAGDWSKLGTINADKYGSGNYDKLSAATGAQNLSSIITQPKAAAAAARQSNRCKIRKSHQRNCGVFSKIFFIADDDAEDAKMVSARSGTWVRFAVGHICHQQYWPNFFRPAYNFPKGTQKGSNQPSQILNVACQILNTSFQNQDMLHKTPNTPNLDLLYFAILLKDIFFANICTFGDKSSHLKIRWRAQDYKYGVCRVW